jgi:hypothetical protein
MLTIVSIVKGWNSCPKGPDSILRIGLGSHELGVPLLVPLSLWVKCAGPSGGRPRSSVERRFCGAPQGVGGPGYLYITGFRRARMPAIWRGRM